MSDKPYTQECSNPGVDDLWTCPGCYADMATKRTGVFTCESCKRPVRYTIRQQPVSHAELVGDDDAWLGMEDADAG